jgi:hypothetical protein
LSFLSSAGARPGSSSGTKCCRCMLRRGRREGPSFVSFARRPLTVSRCRGRGVDKGSAHAATRVGFGGCGRSRHRGQAACMQRQPLVVRVLYDASRPLDILAGSHPPAGENGRAPVHTGDATSPVLYERMPGWTHAPTRGFSGAARGRCPLTGISRTAMTCTHARPACARGVGGHRRCQLDVRRAVSETRRRVARRIMLRSMHGPLSRLRVCVTFFIQSETCLCFTLFDLPSVVTFCRGKALGMKMDGTE